VLRCAGVFCVTGAGEILVSLSDPDAVSSSGDTIPSWRASWDSHVHYTLCTRETLGPVWSGQQRRVDGVSLREVAAWYGALRNAWNVVEKDGGCNDCGSSSFCYFVIASIYFIFGHVFAIVPSFSLFRTIISVWLLY
jgi:hypothetical protein